MSTYTMDTIVARGFSDTVDLVRAALDEQGFGVITEIDMSATLKVKLDVDVPPQVILGACRPVLAHRALLADPSIAALLPCNVVVRSIDPSTTTVEVFDPVVMAGMVDDEAVGTVAADARERLTHVLATVAKES